MRVIAKIGCEGRNCPTIYRKDDDNLVVQGYTADHLFSDGLPEGEHAVVIPVELLKEISEPNF